GRLRFTPTSGFTGDTTFSYKVADGFGGQATALVTISVGNAAPVAAKDSYTLYAGQLLDIPAPGLLANDSDADGDALAISSIDVTGTQGTVQVFADGRMRFTPTAGFIGSTSFSYQVADGLGGTATGQVELKVVVLPALHVSSFAASDSGFRLRFDQAVDVSLIQLYGSGALVPDLSLMLGATAVNGTVVFDADGKGLSFVKAGGVLAAGDYTLRLNGAADGFVSVGGLRLDGNGDGATGDAYVKAFTVAASSSLVVSVEDFARAPGQAASYDPAAGGFVVSVQNASGLNSLSFDLRYDPALLSVQSGAAMAGLPAGSTVNATVSQPGLLHVDVALASPFADNAVHKLVLVKGTVPATAVYGAAELLRLTSISSNLGAAARADDGIHVVAQLGDADGSRALTTADVTLLQRMAVHSDTGFAAYALVNPLLIGDASRDGVISATDAAMVLAASRGTAVAAVPPVVTVPNLVVTQVKVEDDGVSLRFDRVLDVSSIDAGDLQVAGVAGSLVIDADGMGLRFVSGAGAMAAGSYDLTLKSGVSGVVAADGHQLDGNGDGTAGDNFVASFTVPAPATAATLHLGDLNAAAGSSGQVLTLQLDGAAAGTVSLVLAYDPATLQIEDVALAAGLPPGARLTADASQAGRLSLQLSLAGGLGDASLRGLITLKVGVPATATPGTTRLLKLLDATVDGAAAKADNALQTVAAPQPVQLAPARVSGLGLRAMPVTPPPPVVVV
ncbi:Ig-like domain-containing protein, partial [Pelomonas sp. KK5]|uniref:Ig-like domain-containing protein n=1 Tax=Pelomonas sp. KK5 TaxID=1855730 RepID=UPI0018E9EF21